MRQRQSKASLNQCLTSQFPTHLNREFFWALQGIKSDYLGTFRPEQGILLWPTIGRLPRTARSGRQSGMRRHRRAGDGGVPGCLHTRKRRGPPATRSAGWVWDSEVVRLQRGPRACSQGPFRFPLRELTGSFLGLTGNETNPQGSSGQIGENLEPMMGRSTRSFACVER